MSYVLIVRPFYGDFGSASDATVEQYMIVISWKAK